MQKDHKETKAKGARGTKFAPPTVEEIAEYAKQIGFDSLNAEHFWAYYEQIGWVVGKSRAPMKNWRASVVLWKSRDTTRVQQQKQQNGGRDYTKF